MKRNAFYTMVGASLLALCSATFAGEPKIPTSAEEDTDGVMCAAYWQLWNPEVQAKIDKDIEANRKADACFKIGAVAEGSVATVEQISHDFKFGAHIFNYDQLGDKTLNAKYKSLYGTLFNSATVAFYWCKFEMSPNRPRYATEYWDTQEFWANCESPKTQLHWRRPPADEVVDYLKSRDVRVHGHTLIWGNRTYGIPVWLFDKCTDESEKDKISKIIKRPIVEGVKNKPEQYTDEYKKMTVDELDALLPKFGRNLKREFDNRIISLARHYGDKIDSWDVVNESLEEYADGYMNVGGIFLKGKRYGIMPADYTYEAFKIAAKVFPKSVHLNINDNPYGPYRIDKYDVQVNDLVSRGCKIDVVGWQMHFFDPRIIAAIANGDAPKNANYELHMKKITPERMWEDFKKVGRANRPIHMSEITITAPDNTKRGLMVQAIITRNLYRMWFSQKLVNGVTWWNVIDDCGAPGEPSISGLFTRGMEPKPAFFALNNLVNNEWKTKAFEAKPDADGNIKFRGFKGKYRVSWKSADGSDNFKIFYLK